MYIYFFLIILEEFLHSRGMEFCSGVFDGMFLNSPDDLSDFFFQNTIKEFPKYFFLFFYSEIFVKLV